MRASIGLSKPLSNPARRSWGWPRRTLLAKKIPGRFQPGAGLAKSKQLHKLPLDLLPLHCTGNVVCLPDSELNDRERRIAGRTAGKLATVGHEQVPDVMGLSEFVDHTIARLRAHAVGAHI